MIGYACCVVAGRGDDRVTQWESTQWSKIAVEKEAGMCYTEIGKICRNGECAKKGKPGLTPMDAELLSPSDDRVFKLLLTKPEAKPASIFVKLDIHRGRIIVKYTVLEYGFMQKYCYSTRGVSCK